jgi:hypothetical protein
VLMYMDIRPRSRIIDVLGAEYILSKSMHIVKVTLLRPGPLQIF